MRPWEAAALSGTAQRAPGGPPGALTQDHATLWDMPCPDTSVVPPQMFWSLACLPTDYDNGLLCGLRLQSPGSLQLLGFVGGRGTAR